MARVLNVNLALPELSGGSCASVLPPSDLVYQNLLTLEENTLQDTNLPAESSSVGQNLRVHGRALRISVSLGDLGNGWGEFFPDGVRMARLALPEGGLWAQPFPSELNSEPWT